MKKCQKNFQKKYEVEWRAKNGSDDSIGPTLEDVKTFSQQYPALVEAYERQVQSSLSASK